MCIIVPTMQVKPVLAPLPFSVAHVPRLRASSQRQNWRNVWSATDNFPKMTFRTRIVGSEDNLRSLEAKTTQNGAFARSSHISLTFSLFFLFPLRLSLSLHTHTHTHTRIGLHFLESCETATVSTSLQGMERCIHRVFPGLFPRGMERCILFQGPFTGLVRTFPTPTRGLERTLEMDLYWSIYQALPEVSP